MTEINISFITRTKTVLLNVSATFLLWCINNGNQNYEIIYESYTHD